MESGNSSSTQQRWLWPRALFLLSMLLWLHLQENRWSAHFPQMAHMLCVADFILSGQFVIHWENFGVEPDDYHLEKTIT